MLPFCSPLSPASAFLRTALLAQPYILEAIQQNPLVSALHLLFRGQVLTQ